MTRSINVVSCLDFGSILKNEAGNSVTRSFDFADTTALINVAAKFTGVIQKDLVVDRSIHLESSL